jgi:glyoxylate/hydroxypyruvate reductase
MTTVLIATYLEPEHVERIAAEADVRYQPRLLPRPRYQGDHGGERPEFTAADEREWADMLASADVSFDFDHRDPAGLLANAPRLRWVQATSAGIGGFVRRHHLDAGKLIMTTAAGTHAAPLAEFALTGALHFIKDVPGLRRSQDEHHWERRVFGQLAGRRAVVVGLGAIGRRTAEVFALLGAQVTGVGRPGGSYDVPAAARIVSTDELDEVLPGADVLVLATPLTPETENLIDAGRVAKLPDGAIVVNIGRGPVIDEDGLTAHLASGRLGGAALDVFREEPPPAASPLWDLPNVLVSPHSAATAATENALLTDLFLDNLRRFRTGEPLRNLYHPERGY